MDQLGAGADQHPAGTPGQGTRDKRTRSLGKEDFLLERQGRYGEWDALEKLIWLLVRGSLASGRIRRTFQAGRIFKWILSEHTGGKDPHQEECPKQPKWKKMRWKSGLEDHGGA
jgi:hypothetical protein